MHVLLKRGFRDAGQPIAENTANAFPLTGVVVLAEKEKQPASVTYNGTELAWSENAQELTLPISANEDGSAELKIAYGDRSSQRYVFRQPAGTLVEKRLSKSLVEFQQRLREISANGVLAHTRLIRAIDVGELLLLERTERLSGLSDKSMLNLIESIMPFLMNVCSRPRQHLRVDEELRDVELIKRIRPSALHHLASHSEHWKARKLTELIPARMIAEVAEDELNIYENRFVVTLIRKLGAFLDKKQREIEALKGQVDNIIDWQLYAEEFQDHRRLEILQQLLPEYSFEEELEHQMVYEELLAAIVTLQKKLAGCRAGRLYRHLHKVKDVASPIFMTNIMRMDANYFTLYRLWEELNKEEQRNLQKDADDKLPMNVAGAYRDYCAVLLLYALHVTGYVPVPSKPEIGRWLDHEFGFDAQLENEQFRIRLRSVQEPGEPGYLVMEFTRMLNVRLRLPSALSLPQGEIEELRGLCTVEEEHLILHRRPASDELNRLARLVQGSLGREAPGERDYKAQNKHRAAIREWQQYLHESAVALQETETNTIALYPVLACVGQDPKDIEQYTETLLHAADELRGAKSADHAVILLPVNVRELPKTLKWNVVNRLINHGELFIGDDAARWGDYRSGMLPVSPRQINAVQRMLRLVRLHTNARLIRQAVPFSRCVVCGGDKVRADSSGSHQCLSCKAIWGMTRCTQAHCGKEFPWVRPAMKPKSSELAQTAIEQLERKENIGGSFTLTGFHYIFMDPDTVSVVPICPSCGRSAREEEEEELE